jgi:predicted RNase H-like HicB family nuclease
MGEAQGADYRRKGHRNMQLKLTAVFEKLEDGYIGYVEELPGANTQGRTLEEVKANLREAIEMVIEANRKLAEEEGTGKQLITEQIGVLTV